MRKSIVLLLIGCLFTTLLGTGVAPASAETILAIDPVIVMGSSNDFLELELSLPDPQLNRVELLDGNEYDTFSIPEAGIPPVGKPQVPVIIRQILVPNGMEISEPLLVDPGAPDTSYDSIRLNPVQEQLVNLEGAPFPDFVKDETVYTEDLYYPRDYLEYGFAEVGPVQVMRGQQIAELRIYPYHFNPPNNQLEIYPNLKIRIEFEGDIKPINARLESKAFKDLYSREAINADEILELQEEAATPEPPDFGPYGWDYLIFTDKKFEPAANKFAAWKDKIGYKTLVTVLPKGMTAQKIKDAIYTAYSNWDVPPEAVLMIGDAEYIPTFYKTWHDWNPTKYKGNINTQGYIGTDIYYSTLQSELTGLGTIIDPDGDLIPEVLLGRMPVDNAYEAMDLVNAIINYEKNPPAKDAYYNTVVMAAQFQDGGEIEGFGIKLTPDNIEDRRFTQDTEDVAIFLEGSSTNKTVKRLYVADEGSSPQKWNDNKQKYIQSWTNFDGKNTKVGDLLPSYLRSGFKWDADATKITNAIKNGAFLVTHRDHGGRTRWSQPAYESVGDVGLLNNQGLLPVVWSLNCDTGWFDNETDFKGKPGLKDLSPVNTESLAEMWFRNFNSALSDQDYGAVGVVAGTRVTYGHYTTRFLMGMIDAIWPKYTNPGSTRKSIYQMGSVMNHGKAFMSQNTADGIQEKVELEAYHYFGDPTMEIRTQKPPLMVALHDNHWPLYHAGDFGVLVKWVDPGTGDEMAPIKDAKVTVKKADDDESSSGDFLTSSEFLSPTSKFPVRDYWVAYTGDDGVAVFPDLKTGYPGQYEVNVSAPNHIPAFSSFVSTPGSAGGIYLDAEIYSCGASAVVSVADSDLQGAGSVGVNLITDTGDSANLFLSETSGDSGLFSGVIQTKAGAPNTSDNILQVSNEGIITAFYEDENVSGGGADVFEDTAGVDCQAPEFDGLENITLDGCYASLQWPAADDDSGPLTYQVYRGTKPDISSMEMIESTWLLSASDNVCATGVRNYYVVRASDGVSNQDTNTAVHSARFIGQLMPYLPHGDEVE